MRDPASIVAVDYPFPNRLLLKVTGSVDVVEMRRVLMSLRAGASRLTPVLFDLTDAAVQISATDVATLAEMAVREMKRAPLGPVALITTNDEIFGLGRMYQAHNSASGRRQVGVFRDPEAAERWLQTLP